MDAGVAKAGRSNVAKRSQHATIASRLGRLATIAFGSTGEAEVERTRTILLER